MPFTGHAVYVCVASGPTTFEREFSGVSPEIRTMRLRLAAAQLAIEVETVPLLAPDVARAAAQDAARAAWVELAANTAAKWSDLGMLHLSNVHVTDEHGTVGAGTSARSATASGVVADPIRSEDWALVEDALRGARRPCPPSWHIVASALAVRDPVVQFVALLQALVAATWERLSPARQEQLLADPGDPSQFESDTLVVRPFAGDADWVPAARRKDGRESPYMFWRNRMMHPRVGDRWPTIAAGAAGVLPGFRALLGRACRG
jgi:hypothetical protein